MFKDKRNPDSRMSGQIAIAAIGLSLGMIILGLTYLVSFMDILIIVFVPFIAALVALRGDYRAQLLFFFGTIAISFIAWQEGFFQFLPSAIIGLIFGNIVNKLSASFFTYLITLVCALILEILIIYPINFIFSVDMISIYASLLGLSKETFLPIFPLFYLMITSIQTLIMFITVSNELSKLGYIKNKESKFESPLYYLLLDIILGLLILIGYFFVSWLEYLSLGFILLTLGYQIFKVVYPFDKLNLILVSSTFALSIILFFVVLYFLDNSGDNYLCFIPGIILLLSLTLILMSFHKPKDNFENKNKDILKDL